MTSVATKCECCGERCRNNLAVFSAGLGMICPDCEQGATNGVRCLRKVGVEAIHHGPCGDNGERGNE